MCAQDSPLQNAIIPSTLPNYRQSRKQSPQEDTMSLTEHQPASARLVFSALMMMALGLLFGIFLPWARYPILALAAHIQYMINGFLCLLMALLLWPDSISLSKTQSKSVLWCVNSAWTVLALETLSAWWNSRAMSPAVSDYDASIHMKAC